MTCLYCGWAVRRDLIANTSPTAPPGTMACADQASCDTRRERLEAEEGPYEVECTRCGFRTWDHCEIVHHMDSEHPGLPGTKPPPEPALHKGHSDCSAYGIAADPLPPTEAARLEAAEGPMTDTRRAICSMLIDGQLVAHLAGCGGGGPLPPRQVPGCGVGDQGLERDAVRLTEVKVGEHYAVWCGALEGQFTEPPVRRHLCSKNGEPGHLWHDALVTAVRVPYYRGDVGKGRGIKIETEIFRADACARVCGDEHERRGDDGEIAYRTEPLEWVVQVRDLLAEWADQQVWSELERAEREAQAAAWRAQRQEFQ